MICFYLVLVFSCKKSDVFSDVKIIGHAGFGLKSTTSGVHHNTIESFELANNTDGVAGFEADIQFSKDGKIIFYHDSFLDEESELSGCINDCYAEIFKGQKYTGSLQKIAQINDFQLIKFKKNKEIFLDLRETNECLQASIDSLYIHSIITTDFGNKPFLILNSTKYLSFFKNKGFDVFLEIQNFSETQINSINTKVIGYSVRNKHITKEQVQQIKNSGKFVLIYEARSPKKMKEVFEKHPTYFVSDEVKGALLIKYK